MDGLQAAALEVLVDTQLAGDSAGCGHLVSRDHHGADTRFPARRDGSLGLIPQRILHSHQTDQCQFAVQFLRSVAFGQIPVGQGQHPQAASGQLQVFVEDVLAVLGRHGRDPRRRQVLHARSENRSRRALHVGHGLLLGRSMHRDHAAAFRCRRAPLRAAGTPERERPARAPPFRPGRSERPRSDHRAPWRARRSVRSSRRCTTHRCATPTRGGERRPGPPVGRRRGARPWPRSLRQSRRCDGHRR